MKLLKPVLLAVVALSSMYSAAAAARSPVAVEPQQVEIGLLYSGVTVEVRAEAPPGYQVAVRIQGDPQRLELKKLGKKAGILWMPMGSVAFENIPVIYQVLTSAPLRELGSPAALAQWPLSYDAMIPASSSQTALRTELVGLKEHEGLFGIHEGALVAQKADSKSPAAADARSTQFLRGSFRLPARVPPGEYSVDLIGYDKQRAIHLGHVTLQLKHVGAVKALRNLAMEHGLLYGIAASLIAIVVGLLTGLIFQPKSDESH